MSTCKTGKVGFFKNLSSTYSKLRGDVIIGEEQSLERSKVASSHTAQRSDVGSMNKSASNFKIGEISSLMKQSSKLGNKIKSFFKDKIMDKINQNFNENE